MSTSFGYGFESLVPKSYQPYNWGRFEIVTRDTTTDWLDQTLVKQHLNLFDDTSLDDLIAQYELAARRHIETYLGKSIFGQVGRCWYDPSVAYTTSGYLDIPQPNGTVATTATVSYYSNAFPPVLTAVSSTNYFYDPTGSRVVLNGSINASPLVAYPIIADFTLPQDPIAAEPAVRQAALLLIRHLFDNRSEASEQVLKMNPMGFDSLLRTFKPLIM